MQLKVKTRNDLVQHIMEVMGRVSQEIRGQSTVGKAQVLLRLAEGEVTPKELAEALNAEEEDIADSLELFDEFGIVEVVDPTVPSYRFLGYPEEVKFLMVGKPAVQEKFRVAINEIEELVRQQNPSTPEEKEDIAVLARVVEQMRKDFCE